MSWKLARSIKSIHKHFVPENGTETLCGRNVRGWVIESTIHTTPPPEMTCTRCHWYLKLGQTATERALKGLRDRPSRTKIQKRINEGKITREDANKLYRDFFGLKPPCQYCAEGLPRTDDGVFHVWRKKYLVECAEPVLVPTQEQRQEWKKARAKLAAS